MLALLLAAALHLDVQVAIVLVDPPQEAFLEWLRAKMPNVYEMSPEALATLPEGMRAEYGLRSGFPT